MTITRIKYRAPRKSRNPASKPAYERKMLEALARGMSPARAAKAAGVGRSTAYLWRQEDPEFAQKWDDAVAVGIDLLEDEARRRAFEGSDKLLMFLLQRRRPEVWARSHKANRPAPEMAAKSPPALSDAQQTPMTIVGEPECAPASVPAQSKK